MFDSQIFSWSAVTVQIAGLVLTGIEGVSYKAATEKSPIYGKGAKPLAIKAGNQAFTGELTIHQYELARLTAQAPKKDLARLKGLIVTVAYENPEAGGVVTVDQLLGVEFSDVEKAMKQNDTHMVVTLPIMFLDINYDV